MIIDVRPTELALHTRQGNQINNYIDREDVRWGDEQQMKDYMLQFRDQVHRPINPSRKYNCHGLSFASRRAAIEHATEINKIIKEDDYEEIGKEEILPGDVVVYYENGDASHSGIVVQIDEQFRSAPMVLSKWGHCHEVIHQLGRCPYKVEDVRYYRIKI